MKIKTLRKDKVFVPEFNGNRDLPEEEQITVNIKSFPTGPESSSYRGYRFSQDGATEIVYSNDALMLTKHIGSIKGIELDNGEKINNGSTLSKSTCLELSPLISEIREYLLDVAEPLSEGES